MDLRAGDDELLKEVEERLKFDFDQIARGTSVEGLNDGTITGRPCTVGWTLDAPSSAIKFDMDCIGCVRQSAEAIFGDQSANSIQEMTSGAGKIGPEA